MLEIIKDHRGDTFRAVYTLRHVFQKKSKTGRKTPQPDADLIRQRPKDAERIAKGRMT